LPSKTLAGFVTAVVAVIAIAGFSSWALNERSASAGRVTETLEAVSHLQSVLSLLKDAETGQRGYLLTDADSYLEPFQTAEQELPREIAATRHALADKPDQLRRLEVVEQVASEKLAELRGTVELRRAGRGAEALEVVKTNRGRDIMKRARSVVAEMMATEQADLATRNASFVRASELSLLVTAMGSALLLVLIVVAANLSSRDFREQATQAWLRTGQSELAAKLQGEQSVTKLAGTLAGYLAEYLDAQLAAVYFAERLLEPQLAGGWGLAPEATREGSNTSPGGLTSQALKDNRLIHVRDVPDAYFSVSSGTGAHPPRELVVAPLTADGVPNGVVELGFFRPLDPTEIELVRSVSESIGTTFRSAKYRTDLQRLLEETQRQAEELQTQQEELRVSNEELEQQTKTLEESRARLINQQAELEEINAQLEEQTQSLERQRSDLARAQVELERASAYKSEFLANMSHELRTPLNSSLILAKLLVDNRSGNLTEEQVKFAQTIYSAGNDLLTLINDILDLSRIEAGKLDVRPEQVPLSRLLDELSNTFAPIAAQKSLEFAITTRDGLPAAIFTDPVRLQQILKNLLSNAFKFTERGGVFLNVRRDRAQTLAFEVRDTGIGIAPEQHEVIFEAFRQADGTTNRKYGGSGLGLSISRDLARLLGGELGLKSVPQQGSTFTLALPDEYVDKEPGRPKSAPPEPRPTKTTNGGHTNGAHTNGTHTNGTHTNGAAKSPVAEPAATTPDDRADVTPGSRAILIVEDDLAFARILYDLSHELDFKALIAQTAEAGLALAERYRPNAIVLDVGLPDRSGLSVLDALKHNTTTRHIPVHIFSVEDHAQTALEMGALGYALKPLRREELFEAFRKLEAKFTQKLRRVLVVEDDQTARESTCRLLAGDGVEAVGAGSTAEALAALADTRFDCLVLDLSLPDRSGFELLEEMTANASSPPPVIVYTGRSLSREEEHSLRRFSTSIIIKGARSPERLLDEVTLFLHQVEADLPADRRRMLKSAREREAVFEGRRVLIVEDDVRNIFALTSVLEPRGAHIEIARNGREAVEHLRDKPGVDLVLMDVMMPEMDGLEAMRKIRERRELAKLPIIALTAKAMADDRDNCLAAGANDYIAKPVDVDKLLSLARVWMPK
jgi:signal transduction histidine kinase/DNA-binding response OmpR family regulator/CHASE3 domain sensor protein